MLIAFLGMDLIDHLSYAHQIIRNVFQKNSKGINIFA